MLASARSVTALILLALSFPEPVSSLMSASNFCTRRASKRASSHQKEIRGSRPSQRH